MKKLFFLITVLAFGWSATIAQNVAINADGSSPDASAMLDVKSTSKGFLAPRVSSTGDITSPATGLLVYQTGGTPGYYYNSGTPASPSWVQLGAASGASQWTTTGSDIYYSSGNVGIGTSVPYSRLSLGGNTGNISQRIAVFESTTGHYFYGIGLANQGNNVAGLGLYGGTGGSNPTDNNPHMYIQNDGNVGIGTTTPSAKLSILSTTEWGGMTVKGGTTADGSTIGLSNSNGLGNYSLGVYGSANTGSIANNFYLYDNVASAVRMTVASTTGNVGIGITTPGSKLHVEANVSNHYAAVIRNYNNTSSGYGLQVVAGSVNADYGAYLIDFFSATGATRLGSITQSGSSTVLYNTSSDRRLKNNIVNTHFGVADLLKIQVRDYVYKADASNTLATGFIAQELYEIFPNAVSKPAKAEDMWSVDYGKVTPLLVKAIQDQQALIEALQAENSSLKAENTSIKSDVEALKSAVYGTAQMKQQ